MTCQQPFFSTPERNDALRIAALHCVGTPFAAKQMVPGAGMDCVRLPGWCFLQSGFFAKFTPPNYAIDSGSHSRKSYLIDWFENWSEIQADDSKHFFARADKPQLGDCVCVQTPKTLSAHHCGLFLDDKKFAHTIYWGERKVIVSDLQKESFYQTRVRAIFRPMHEPKEAAC